MKRKKPVKLPKPCRFYLLADEESGQVDGSCFYTSALSARAAGETSELVALYSFMGYRGRGKQKAPLDESDETSGGSPCRCEKVGADTVSRHVDDFIDDPSSDPYAASWFESFRRPALDKLEAPNDAMLFATYQGARYRVTGCSCLGDVWLHSDVQEDIHYEHRVDVAACSEWGADG